MGEKNKFNNYPSILFLVPSLSNINVFIIPKQFDNRYFQEIKD